MEFKKIKIESTAVTRDIRKFDDKTNNIYEAVVIITKRADIISKEVKEELSSKIEEFSTTSDTLEEVFENREQIELARHYESMPKSTLIAVSEFLADQIHFRNPHKEEIGSF